MWKIVLLEIKLIYFKKMQKIKIINLIIILGVFITFSSFHKHKSETSNYLFQKWVYHDFDDNNLIYKSEIKFNKNKPGLEFYQNKTITIRQNIGWCATPPIEYETIKGSWSSITDSLIEIEYKNWNGLKKDTLKIIKISKSTLILKPIFSLE